MKRCKFVSHLATFWHSYKGGEAARTSKFKQRLNSYGLCQCPLSLEGPSSMEKTWKPRRSINTHKQKCYTRGSSLSGMKILANFDELIGEQTGNTGLGRLIIINVAHLQSCYFFFFFCYSMNFEGVKKTHFQYQFYR